MKTHGVLLVNFNVEEVESVRKIFKELNLQAALFPVFNGRAALDMLMGSYGPSGVRPDIIMVASQLPDMSSLELLGIIRKYYSLGNIRFYVLADAGEKFEDDPNDSLQIGGVLYRPLTADEQTLQVLGSLKTRPEKHRLGLLGALGFPPGLIKGATILKQKLVGMPAAFSGVTKAAMCVSLAIIPGVAAIHSLQKGKQSVYAPPKMEVMRITPDRPQTISVPMDAEEFVEPEVQEPEPVIAKEKPVPVVDTVAIEIPVQDSPLVPVKKTFSIGVKKADH